MPRSEPSRAKRSRLRGGLEPLLLGALVLGSAHALGGVHAPVVLALAAVALASLVALALSPREPRRASLVPAFVLLGLAWYTLAQVLPLPMALLARLSPAAADTWSQALRPLGESIAWAPLSLDPPSTALEACKGAIYAATFLLACSVGRKRGATLPIALVALSSLTVALSAIGHQLVGATKVYGLYEPLYATYSARLSPILNPNNLAGYLVLGALAGLALLVARRPIASPWLLGGGVVLMVAAVLRTGSRGGALALPLGLVVVVVLAARARRRAEGGDAGRELQIATIAATTTLLGGLMLGVLGADAWVWSELLNADLEKLKLPAMAWPLLRDHVAFGVGRGAFGTAFLAYRPPLSTNATYTHPENFAVQWLSEWGWPVTLVACGVFAWWMRPSKLGAGRSALVRVALVGVVVLFLQNLGDLGLELPAHALAVVTVLGGVLGDTRRHDASPDATPRTERLALGLAAAALVVSTTVSLAMGARTLEQDRRVARALVESAIADPTRAPAARAALAAQLRRHPADYYFPQLGATLAWRTRLESPTPWIQRALERGPTNGRTHLLLAEVLAERGATSQALLELRLAAEQESMLAGQVGRTALRYTRDFDRLLAVVPPGAAGPAVLDTMAANLPAPSDRELRERLDREALRRDPRQRGPRERLVHARLEAYGRDVDPCADRELCEQELLAHAQAFIEHHPQSSRGQQLAAQLAILDDRREDARALLLPACEKREDALGCLALLAQVEPLATLDEVIKRYTSRSCLKRDACAAAWDFAAGTYQGRGAPAQAAGAATKAAQTEPTLERWLRAAELSKLAGLGPGERTALEQAVKLGAGDDARARLEALPRR